MTSDRLQTLDEMVAKLFRDDSPISTGEEPSLATSADQPIIDEAVFEASVIETAGDGGNVTTMAEQPDSGLAGLDLDTAIRLRWTLRDIKAGEQNCPPSVRTISGP